MRFQKISYLAVLALSCAAVAAPHPDPQDNGSLTNTVPIAWHDVEAGAYAVQSSNTVDPKRSVDESEHISFAHSKDTSEDRSKNVPEPGHHGPDNHFIPHQKIQSSNVKRNDGGRFPSGKPNGLWGPPGDKAPTDGQHKEVPSGGPTHHSSGPMRRDPSPDDTPEQMNDWALTRFCEHNPTDHHCVARAQEKRAAVTGPCEGVNNACVGDITHWDGGQSACGPVINTETDMAIALPSTLMGLQSNNNPYCGRRVMIKNPRTGAVVGATVKEKCMGCTGASIDLTNALFRAVDPSCDGRCSGYHWWFV